MPKGAKNRKDAAFSEKGGKIDTRNPVATDCAANENKEINNMTISPAVYKPPAAIKMEPDLLHLIHDIDRSETPITGGTGSTATVGSEAKLSTPAAANNDFGAAEVAGNDFPPVEVAGNDFPPVPEHSWSDEAPNPNGWLDHSGCPLPNGWQEILSPTGNYFFVHHDLKLKSWVDPRVSTDAQGADICEESPSTKAPTAAGNPPSTQQKQQPPTAMAAANSDAPGIRGARQCKGCTPEHAEGGETATASAPATAPRPKMSQQAGGKNASVLSIDAPPSHQAGAYVQETLRASRPCQRTPAWESGEGSPCAGNAISSSGFRDAIMQRILGWKQSLKRGGRKLVKDVTNTGFRLHSGASDVLIVRHRDRLRSSQWHVHLGRDINVAPAARLRLELWGASTDVIMQIDDARRGVFDESSERESSERGSSECPGLLPPSLRPSSQQLEALRLKSGYNEAAFVVEEPVVDAAPGKWEVRGKMGVGVFMWDSSDRVVVADMEAVIAKRDVWSKSADMVLPLLAPVAPQGRAALLDGVGQVLSYLDRAGYRVLLLQTAAITRAARSREAMHKIRQEEVEQWGRGAALPDCPIITTQARMGTVMLGKLADKINPMLSPLFPSPSPPTNFQVAFKAAALAEIAQLFAGAHREEETEAQFVTHLPEFVTHLPEAAKAQPGEGGGEKGGGEKGGGEKGGGALVFSGGLCGSPGDARVYEAAGVPSDRIFVVEGGGSVWGYYPQEAERGRESALWPTYVDMYPHLHRLFPKVPRISRDARREGEVQPPEGEEEWGSRGRTRGDHAEGEGAVRGSLPQPSEGGQGEGSRSEGEGGYAGGRLIH